MKPGLGQRRNLAQLAATRAAGREGGGRSPSKLSDDLCRREAVLCLKPTVDFGGYQGHLLRHLS